MKTVGEIFRETRQRKKIPLGLAAEKTKIPIKYLEAVELGQQTSFPGFRYAQLYVRDYAQFLGLSSQKMVSLFRRDWEGDRKEGDRREVQPAFFLSRNSLMICLLTVLIGSYLVYQYFVFNSPPLLKATVSCLPGKILIEGKTNPRATVKIEGKTVSLTEKGEFTQEIYTPWPKTILVQAESLAGKIKEETIIVKCSS